MNRIVVEMIVCHTVPSDPCQMDVKIVASMSTIAQSILMIVMSVCVCVVVDVCLCNCVFVSLLSYVLLSHTHLEEEFH